MRYGPQGDAAPATPSVNSKASNAAKHGAAAVLMVHPPRYHGPDELVAFGGVDAASKVPFIQITQDVANDLFRRASARDLTQLQDAIDSDLKPRSFELKDVKLSGNVAIERK